MSLASLLSKLLDSSGKVPQSKVSGGPAFSAYRSSSQTVSSGVLTKVQFDTEEFDTNAAYDNATNFRFQPNVAGYYVVAGRLAGVATTAASSMSVSIYKNGAVYKVGSLWTSPGGLQGMSCDVSGMVQLNGTTDYVELWVQAAGTGAVSVSGSQFGTFFQAAMARGA
jgi:hypothetical protein